MIVHAGNDASRPRGATTLRDHPDALWSLSKDSAGRRYFKAEGRDVDLDEGELLYDATSRRLTFNPGSGRRSSTDGLKSAMLSYIVEHPGCMAKDVDSAVRGSKAKKAELRNDLQREGLIEVKDGERNAKLFYPAPSLPVFPESFSESGTLGVSSRSPLSIGGTTGSGGLIGPEPPGFDEDTTENPHAEPRIAEDWPRLLRVAGL